MKTISNTDIEIDINDIIVTDNEKLANQISSSNIKPKRLTYANRVALHNIILQEKPTKIILENYSETTKQFIKDNNIQTILFYPEDTIKIGLAIDELEIIGGTTKTPKIHHFQ